MRKVIFLLALLVPLVISAKTYLVAVGVSEYPQKERCLRLPANDAATIRYLYSKNSNTETVLITNSNATQKAVLIAMQKAFVQAKANDIIVFFFSGHGSPGNFCLYDSNVPYAKIRAVMAKSKAKNKMIFADACYSGRMRQGRKKQTNNNDQSLKNSNVMLFLSSRGNEKSIERLDMKNGFFTSCLQKGLRGGADTNRDKTITAKELFTYVSAGVKKISDDAQHPVMWGKFSDNMPVIVW